MKNKKTVLIAIIAIMGCLFVLLSINSFQYNSVENLTLAGKSLSDGKVHLNGSVTIDGAVAFENATPEEEYTVSLPLEVINQNTGTTYPIYIDGEAIEYKETFVPTTEMGKVTFEIKIDSRTMSKAKKYSDEDIMQYIDLSNNEPTVIETAQNSNASVIVGIYLGIFLTGLLFAFAIYMLVMTKSGGTIDDKN